MQAAMKQAAANSPAMKTNYTPPGSYMPQAMPPRPLPQQAPPQARPASLPINQAGRPIPGQGYQPPGIPGQGDQRSAMPMPFTPTATPSAAQMPPRAQPPIQHMTPPPGAMDPRITSAMGRPQAQPSMPLRPTTPPPMPVLKPASAYPGPTPQGPPPRPQPMPQALPQQMPQRMPPATSDPRQQMAQQQFIERMRAMYGNRFAF